MKTGSRKGAEAQRIGTTEGAESADLKVGDAVTWTHRSIRGSSINYTTRTGKISHRSKVIPVAWMVKYRGKLHRVHETHLRKVGQTTTLTEMVMGLGASAPLREDLP